jgi:Tol biopolymer transport system component
MAGRLTLNDISREGRVIMTLDNERVAINCLLEGETIERDLSWLDWSTPRDLSEDGKRLLIAESGGEGGGATYVSYLRKTDGSPAVRLTEGIAYELSPDGKWVIAAVSRNPPVQLSLVPTGAGEPRSLTNDAIHHANAGWFPDGKRFLFEGIEPGHRGRLYVQHVAGGTPTAITPEGVSFRRNSISPDGKFVTGIDADRRVWIYPADGGEAHLVPGLTAGDLPIRWGADSRSLYVYRREELPAKVYRIDVETGRKELWKELMPYDKAGIEYIPAILLTPDGKSYVYSYYRSLSDLYLVEGLK